jgi:hypothetical protein
MNAVHEAIASFKEKQREVFHALQQQQNLVERDLELFSERVESAAWQDVEQHNPSHAPPHVPQEPAPVGSVGRAVCPSCQLDCLGLKLSCMQVA